MSNVIVYLFDLDACLWRASIKKASRFNAEDRKNHVLSTNKTLLDRLKAEALEFDRRYSTIFSARQAYFTDLDNKTRSNPVSATEIVPYVSEYLGTEMVTFLMADIQGDLPHGTSFERIVQAYEGQYTGDHYMWEMDREKVTILYAQMHKFANEHPGDDITLKIFDDNKEVINPLHDFFTTFPHLIPTNVTLEITRYYEPWRTPKTPIERAKTPVKGTGLPNPDYAEYVKLLLDRTEYEVIEGEDIPNTINTVLKLADVASFYLQHGNDIYLPIPHSTGTLSLPPIPITPEIMQTPVIVEEIHHPAHLEAAHSSRDAAPEPAAPATPLSSFSFFSRISRSFEHIFASCSGTLKQSQEPTWEDYKR